MSVTKLMLTGFAKPELVFCSVATAAAMLELSNKHIFRLVNDGHLERVRLVDRKGSELAVGITEDSVHAYAKAPRTRWARRQLDLIGEGT